MNLSYFNSTLDTQNLKEVMSAIGKNLQEASRILAMTPSQEKVKALKFMAAAIREDEEKILASNQQDLKAAENKSLKPSFVDRLTLTYDRVFAMAKAIEDIAQLPDPIGAVIASWERPNGLKIERIRTPLGVVGVIFESRPNVTADAGALCLMAGNAVLLRGGSEGFLTNQAIHAAMQKGLIKAGLPEAVISIVPTSDRDAVGMMLNGLDGSIDVIVPRGGKNLVARVQQEAKVPVFAHLEGLVHLYVDKSVNSEMANEIVYNSKMRRTGICGALETLLIHKDIANKILPDILNRLHESGCEIRGDEMVCKIYPRAEPAEQSDWSTEYLDAILSVKLVDSIEQACEHIAEFGSEHTDGIITHDEEAAKYFFMHINSAIVVHNASTQFADGGEFGMGAEIGIATGKMHARGPIGVEQLTSFQYHVKGTGQTRPQ